VGPSEGEKVDEGSIVRVARAPADPEATCEYEPDGVALEATPESAGEPAIDQAIVTTRTRTSTEAAARTRGWEIRDGIRLRL
jgi:hypothetical protein